jgi:hypothetical protein
MAKNHRVWEIPNSRIVITLTKHIDVMCGIALKDKKDLNNVSWSIWNIHGYDEFNALENLIAKTQKASEIWWDILTLIQNANVNDIEIQSIIDYWNMPNYNNTDFEKCSLAMINHLNHSNIKLGFIFTKHVKKYSACLIDKTDNEIIFKGAESGIREIALNNLNNIITALGGYLDKIQKNAWEALLDRENHHSEMHLDVLTGKRLLTNRR